MKTFLSFMIILSIILSFLVIAQGDGTVFSETFEDGMENWSFNNNSYNDKFVVDENNSSEGKKSLLCIDDNTQSSMYISSKRFFVEPSKLYKLGFDAKVVEGTRSKIYIQFFNATNQRVYNNSMYASGADWRKYTFVHETPSDAVEGVIIIMSQDSTTGTTCFDDIFVKEVPKKAADLSRKLQSLKAGDVLEIEDGIYEDIKISLTEQGSKEKPITIRAKNLGQVILKGDTQINVKGSCYVFEGLRFEECIPYHIVYIDANANDCVINECAFYNNAPLSGPQFWIILSGKRASITNCYFSNKNSVGQMLCFNEVAETVSVANEHLVENCYFGNIVYQSDNGYEAIRMGRGDKGSFANSKSIVQGCFFENCDGEAEIVSVKSNFNHVRYNTFYNSKGGVVLRHGNENSVYGNLFIGGETDVRNQGVRITGERQKVYNNYFFNQPETSTTLAISDGCSYEGIQYFYYYPVVDAMVYNNTFIGGDKTLQIGKYSPNSAASSNMIIAPQGKVYNNAIISYTGNSPLVENGDPNHKVVLENNYVYGKELGYEGDRSGIIYESPAYREENGFVKFENGIGADIEEVKKTPKTPFDILSSWMVEEYYKTGLNKFEKLESDPFNNGFKLDNLLPSPDKINVIINGYVKEFDVEPQLINSRTMVPMRGIFEELGAEVLWDEKTATATAATSDITVKITENSDKAYVNDKEIKLDSSAVIVNGRFLVPLRFVSESFGAKVGWADQTQTAVITYKKIRSDGFDGIERKVMHNIENAIPVMASYQSGDDGAGASVGNIFDGSYSTRWGFKKQDNGEDGYGILELDSIKELESIYLGFYNADKRTYTISVYVSDDNIEYKPVLEKVLSTVKTKELEKFDLGGAKGRYIKIIGHGNSQNEWNNITELVITGK